MNKRGRQIAAGAAAICLAATTACTGGSSVKLSQLGSATTSPTSTSSGATDFSKPVANEVSARKNVTLSSCERHHGVSTASGNATNSGSSEVKYHVTVFYTSRKATDLAKAETVVTVPANGTAKWSTKASFHYNPTVLCVLVGVAKA